MILDTTAFGSAIGLVSLGWMAGLVAAYIFSILRRTGSAV